MSAVLKPAAQPAMLSIDGIDTFYGETQALFGVSLEVGAGEVVALLGPNGAGKTTTLRSILGLTPARRGRVHFDGRDITRMPTHEIARGGIGWVPDDRRIFPTLTVARNLAIARKKHALSRLDREGMLRDLQRAGIPDAPRMREPVGRRDADGGDLARAARLAGPGAVRRAEPGPGAEGGAGRDEDHHAAQGRRHRGAAGRAERAERAAGRRPRLRDEPRHASCTKGRPRSCATTQRCAGSCWGSDGAHRFCRSSNSPSSTRAAWSASRSPSRWRPTSRSTSPQRGRRDGAQRLGQDHAVRADHRQQPAHGRAACWCKARTSTRCARASATAWRSTTTSPTRCARSSAASPTSCSSMPRSDSPLVHLFDEPQFNTQDGYIGFMLDFFARLRSEGKLVFLCLHPNEPYHVDILRAELRALHLRAEGRRDAGAGFRHPRTGRFSAHLPWRTCARSMTTSIHHFISGRIVPGTSGRSQDVSPPIPQLALI